MTKEEIFWLSATQGIGSGAIRAIQDFFCDRTDRQVFEAGPPKELMTEKILDRTRFSLLQKSFCHFDDACRKFTDMDRHGIRMVTWMDADFPDRLQRIPSPPAMLFVKGTLPPPHVRSAAVCGARACSPYGASAAHAFGRLLAENGIPVISGFAAGIDACAHRGALSVPGGYTLAVLGCGVDICYPACHLAMYEEVLEHGCILSEFAPGTPALPQNFPMRNRIISGLSDAVFVIEARKRSGSLITAAMAAEQGRDVYALPGRMGDELSAGCNSLIADGAGIIESSDTVRRAMGLSVCGKHGQEKKAADIKAEKRRPSGNTCQTLSPIQQKVLDVLSLAPMHTDDVISKCGLAAGDVICALAELELLEEARSSGSFYTKAL